MTARKVLGYFEKKATVSEAQAQTDFEFVDPDKWARTQQKIALMDAAAKELRAKISECETELDVKHRVHMKLQHEIDVERGHKETALRDLAALRDEQSNLIRLYTTDKKTLQLTETELEEKWKLVKALRKEVIELKGKVDQKQFVIEWFENNHSAGSDQLKEVRKELRVLYKQYFQPKLMSKILPGQPDSRRRSFGYAINPYAEPLVKIRRTKSANLWKKRDPQTTLGLVIEEDDSSDSVQKSPSAGLLLQPSSVSVVNPADPSALPDDQQPDPSANPESDSMAEEQDESSAKHRGRRTKRRDVEPDDPDYEDYQRERDLTERSGSEYGDYEEADDRGRDEQGDDREPDGREGEELTKTVAGGRKVRRKEKGRKRKDTLQSESTATKQAAPSIASSFRGRPSHTSTETDAVHDSTLSKTGEASSSIEPGQARVPGPAKRRGHGKDQGDTLPSGSSRVAHKDSYSQSSQHQSYPGAEEHMRAQHLYTDDHTDSVESEDRPGSHYIPSVAVEEVYLIGENDKVVMTDALQWIVVESNSVGVQFNYLKPELTYGEEGDALMGADGVKYYMWPLNPNQLYGLSGDVFYHTVMKAFQAMPRVPLSRTGEPHHPPFLLSDSVTGTKVEGETRLSPTKARMVDHSPNCGVNCKHLKRRGRQQQGKKESLLPIARQELKYERK